MICARSDTDQCLLLIMFNNNDMIYKMPTVLRLVGRINNNGVDMLILNLELPNPSDKVLTKYLPDLTLPYCTSTLPKGTQRPP